MTEKLNKGLECLVWKGWALINKIPFSLELFQRIMRIFGSRIPKIGPVKYWTACRSTPAVSETSLHDLVKEKSIDNE